MDIRQDEEEDLRSPQEIAFLESLRDHNLKDQIVFKENYEQEPQYYYYKRWVWMQFPWGCGSFKSNYSEFITENYARATEYMTVQEEQTFTRAAVDIVIAAEKRTAAIFAKPKQRSMQNIDSTFLDA